MMKKIMIRMINSKGMTLVEILVAIVLLTILIFVFIPFLNNSFKGILLAGQMHESLAGAKSTLDEAIAKEDYYIASSYPLSFSDGSVYNVEGTLIADGELATFLAFDPIVSFESGLIQEGYAGNSGTFNEADPLSVKIIGQSIHLSSPGGFFQSQIVRFSDRDGNDVSSINPNFDYSLLIHDSDHADIIIESGKYGLDNAHSPYAVSIETRYGYFFTWRREVINLGIEINLPTYMALGTNGVEEMSSNAIDWLAKDNRLPNATFNGIAWGNSRFVAVGDGGRIYYLKDKQEWTQISTVINDNLIFIKYINGIFIAGGANGRLMTSSDGLTWSIRSTGITDTITGIAYSANTYIASCDESVNTPSHVADFLISNNLSDWTLIESPVSDFYDVTDIEYDGNKFVAVGGVGKVVYSSDLGSTWNSTFMDSTLSRRVDLKSIVINLTGDIGVIVGKNGLIYTYNPSQTSLVVDSFSRRDDSPVVGRETLNDVVYSNGYYIAVGNNETLKYSLDAVTWSNKSAISEMGASDIKCITGRN